MTALPDPTPMRSDEDLADLSTDDVAVARFLDAHRSELIAFRRHLHAHPELSYAERETTALVAGRLTDAGLEPRVLAGGCGLVCDIGVTGEGPLVALRADLDALAMDDQKDVPYKSTRPGAAHACGHDLHTTVVLGAGLALHDLLGGRDGHRAADARASVQGSVRGGVRLIFEPAEEVQPSGAIDVLAEGGLDGVSAIFGMHCDPKLDVGSIGVRVGALTAATDQVEIELIGPGGHTARPQLTVDLVAVAGRLAADLPAIVRQLTADRGEVLLVFGMLHSGDAANVIPTHATLRGTLRTHDRAAWDQGEAAVRAALAEALAGTGATFALDYARGTPPVVNDADETALVASIGRALLGDDSVAAAPRSFGGDSFAYYVDRVPGTYVRLGVHDPAREEQLDLHSGAFDVHEGALDVGVRVLVATALAAIAARS